MLVFASWAAMAAEKDPAECAGYAPPYRNSCSFPIAVWYKAESGPVKSFTLAPGQAGGDKGAGSWEIVCKQGETAYAWSGGAHGNAP